MQPSNSPNGRSLVDAPRRGDSYGHVSIAELIVLSHGPPASSTVTLTPARVSAYAAIPPPAPEPTTSTSTGDDWVARRIQGSRVIPRIERLHPANGNLRVIPGPRPVGFFFGYAVSLKNREEPM